MSIQKVQSFQKAANSTRAQLKLPRCHVKWDLRPTITDYHNNAGYL